ncbi:MAG: ribosome maturation factor RimM [Christensenellales bacterium]|jgi:16S rRNA processing protein RimM
MDGFRIGLIVRPHGVKGMLKVLPLTDDPSRFMDLDHVWVEKAGKHTEYPIVQASTSRGMVYVQLEGIDRCDLAETLRDCYLCVERKNAVALPQDTYFIKDLLECSVENEQGFVYGRVKDVLQTGANDVYIVGNGQREWLLPAIKKVIRSVDIQDRRITVEGAVFSEVVPDAD